LSASSPFSPHATTGPQPQQPLDKAGSACNDESAPAASQALSSIGSWWPYKRFMQHARYDDKLLKLQRWFGVDAFLTVRPCLCVPCQV
jgi:hypothetical protein